MGEPGLQDYTQITVEPASRNCGAFVSGVDLKRPQDDAVYREIHAALMRHQVVFFREQDVTPQEQTAFARHSALCGSRTARPSNCMRTRRKSRSL